MGVGEYSFTPTSVTKFNKNMTEPFALNVVTNGGVKLYSPTSVTKFSKNMTEPFALFGGTSLAAPLVAGSAAILMQSLKDKGIPYDPFTIKNILTSTASDMGNDPYTQGSGLVNVTNAVNFVL